MTLTMFVASAKIILTAYVVLAVILAMHVHWVCTPSDVLMLAAVGECTHEFHMHCINRWLMERHEPLCPLCKRPWGMLLTPLTRSRSDDSSPHGLCLDTHHSTRRAPEVPGHEVGQGVSPRKHHVT